MSHAAVRPIAALVLASSALAGCAGTQGLAPSLRGVEARLAGVDFDGVDLAFDLDLDNPLPVGIPATQFSYDFAVEGAPLASAKSAKLGAVPAAQATKHTVPMRVGFRELAKVVEGLSDKNEAAYRFAGSLALPALGQTFTLPFEKQGTFPVVRPPSISVRSVDTSGLSYTGGTLAVDADFTNPNAFGLGIEDLGWALDFGGKRIGGFRAATQGEVGANQTRSLRLEAGLTVADALTALAKGKGALPKLVPTGSVTTPWGAIPLK